MTGSMQQGITALHCSVCSDSLIPAAELCSVMLMHINIILITHNTNIILISNGFKSDIRVNWKDVASPVSLWRLHASLRAARVQFHICAVTLPGQQGAHYGLTGSDLRLEEHWKPWGAQQLSRRDGGRTWLSCSRCCGGTVVMFHLTDSTGPTYHCLFSVFYISACLINCSKLPFKTSQEEEIQEATASLAAASSRALSMLL